MVDLEEEFNKLVDGMYQQVQHLEDTGAIGMAEAEDLRQLILQRTQVREPAWNSSGCSMGGDYYDYDSGWTPSQNC